MVLTNDAANRAAALAMGLKALSLPAYAASRGDVPELNDLVARTEMAVDEDGGWGCLRVWGGWGVYEWGGGARKCSGSRVPKLGGQVACMEMAVDAGGKWAACGGIQWL